MGAGAVTKKERSRRWREARASAEGRRLLSPVEAMERAHQAAHSKLREGMCVCGACRKCRHRMAVAEGRARSSFYSAGELDPELTRRFPIFAEELASTMRYVR